MIKIVRMDTAKLRVGQRVSRITTDEHGTVTETNGLIKVKWDRGRTSYFHRGKPANVRLIESSVRERTVRSSQGALPFASDAATPGKSFWNDDGSPTNNLRPAGMSLSGMSTKPGNCGRKASSGSRITTSSG